MMGRKTGIAAVVALIGTLAVGVATNLLSDWIETLWSSPPPPSVSGEHPPAAGPGASPSQTPRDSSKKVESQSTTLPEGDEE
jgi:hypothetical protein